MFFKELFCLAILVALANTEVPPYIHVCGARNPNLDKCIQDSVTVLNKNIREGMPEFGIPPIDPLTIEEVVLSNTPSLQVKAMDIKLWGLADYEIKYFHMDLEKKEIDIEMHFDKNRIEAKYSASVRILVPLTGHGPVHIIANDVTGKSKMKYKLVERGGKEYAFFYTMKSHLYVGNYTSKFEVEGTNDKVLENAINEALGGTNREILTLVTPNIEKAIAEKVLEMANNVCKRLTYAEIFPDRE